LIEESFQKGLLDYPQYTRPYDFEGIKVPDILLKGDHQRVKEWREKKARERTAQLRPDLLEKWEESRKR
jgi:tRNA (guanine37-N1)-methyltransferase